MKDPVGSCNTASDKNGYHMQAASSRTEHEYLLHSATAVVPHKIRVPLHTSIGCNPYCGDPRKTPMPDMSQLNTDSGREGRFAGRMRLCRFPKVRGLGGSRSSPLEKSSGSWVTASSRAFFARFAAAALLGDVKACILRFSQVSQTPYTWGPGGVAFRAFSSKSWPVPYYAHAF